MTGETKRRARVLVVDDQPVNLQLMAEVLRDLCDVLVAASGARALEIAALGGVDLILLDVMMPGMDGIEVCARLNIVDAPAIERRRFGRWLIARARPAAPDERG